MEETKVTEVLKLENKKIMNFDVEVLKEQVYSFVKSFFFAFITIAYFADMNGIDIFTLSFLVGSLKASSLMVLRNIYKVVTEKKDKK